MRPDDATILVVDDEAILQEICAVWLKGGGYQHVFTVSNGVEALEFIKERRIDILLTDINMPKMGGVQLIRTLRERGFPMPEICFMSAYIDVDLAEMERLGVKRFLEKPFTAETIVEVVAMSLGAKV